MRITMIGATCGVLASLAAVRFLTSLFGGVQANDARPDVVAFAVLVSAMIAAAYFPARRAARLNPAEVLRSD
jgi:putative ABC transport system permease protein